MSVKELGRERYRLRWRERLTDGRQVAQSWTVACSASDAERWALEVYEAVRDRGSFTRPAAGARPVRPSRPAEADLCELHVSYAEWKVVSRRIKPATLRILRSSFARAELEIRDLEGLPAVGPIPASVLSVELCTRLTARLARGVSSGGEARAAVGPARQAQILSAVYGAWMHGSDDPDRWPGLRPAPRDKAKVIPRGKRRTRPDPAPSVAEMDAILRHARASQAPLLAEFLEVQRATGLREFQVRSLQVSDVLGLDSPVPRLAVRVGKSAQEDEGRIVPVAPVLVPTLRRLTRGREPGERLLRRGAPINSSTLRRVFEAAEGAGELRPAVWRSELRDNARTTHCMRAGLQRLLRRAGVEDRVIDVLVGHAGRSTRDRHYDDSDWPELVAAVRQVPAVRWRSTTPTQLGALSDE